MKKLDRAIPWCLLVFAFATGLRLLWLGDFEYKADQIYTYQATQSESLAAQYPSLGMPSRVGLRDPGASV